MTRKLKTRTMHGYTLIQVFFVILLFSIKTTVASPAFPFVVLALLPTRSFLIEKLFTSDQLVVLDDQHHGETETDEEDEDTLATM